MQIALRAIHYASTMLLFGELVFALCVAGPAFGFARIGVAGDPFGRRFLAVARLCLVASVVSGGAWFAVAAAGMSGMPIEEAMTRDTLDLILGTTLFGRVCAERAGIAIALAAVLVALGRSSDDARRLRLAIVAAAFAALYLGALALVGHAIAGDESEGAMRIVADGVHLLAAGAWLGALPALVSVLGRGQTEGAAAHAARRFSTLGVAGVGVLVASGLANAWYQVGDIPALVGTDYGRLLVAKLALFAAMLVLATVNRGITARPLSGDGRNALQRIRRNAVFEIALGIGVIAIVGVLGVTIPAAHQPPIWPFDRMLSLDAIRPSAWGQFVASAAGATACLAAVALVAGGLVRPPRLRIAAVAGIVLSLGVLSYLLALPAYPTSYLVSPVRYTADAIAIGSMLYAENCAACHGREGRGAGPEALSLPNARPNLNDSVPERREGDLYWSIAHGIPDTPMPGFASRLNDVEIWSLIKYLDAQVAAQNALAMADRMKPLRPVPAPDFTYEFIGRPQQSLRPTAGDRVTLLVFYTVPTSLPRLRELATLEREYGAAGARIIALPMPDSAAVTAQDTTIDGKSMLALAAPAVATVYLMFARESRGADDIPPAHVEYLIDRFGFLRLRWIGLREATAGAAGMRGQLDLLVREPPREQVRWGHRH